MKIEKVNIGLLIEQRMNELDINKSELARRCNIPNQNINRILERSSINTNRLATISEALDYNFFAEYVDEEQETPGINQIMHAMETINDRMEQIVNEKFDGNKAAFAKSIGLGPTGLSNYLGTKRRSKPSADMLAKIVLNLGVDARWLLLGERVQQVVTTPNSLHSQFNSGGEYHNENNDKSDAILQERIKLLEALLAEKERLISVLMARRE